MYNFINTIVKSFKLQIHLKLFWPVISLTHVNVCDTTHNSQEHHVSYTSQKPRCWVLIQWFGSGSSQIKNWMKSNIGCVIGQMALANHFGNLREDFIPSLVKKSAYRRCSRNTKKQQFSKSCKKEIDISLEKILSSYGSKKKKGTLWLLR